MILLKDSSFGSNISYICKDETRSTLETIMPYSLFNYAMLLFLETIMPYSLINYAMQLFLETILPYSLFRQLSYYLLWNNYAMLLFLKTIILYYFL